MALGRIIAMKTILIAAGALAVVIGAGAGAIATINQPQPKPASEVINPMIDGVAMLPTADIADNITISPEHSALTIYLEETNLDAVLKGKGPFTLFAPTDKALVGAGKLGARADLTKLINYQIVPGRFDYRTLLAMIGKAGGHARLKTLEGGTLFASLNGPRNIQLMDENGGTANISVYDIRARNGVIQVVDHVLKPAGFDNRRPVLTSSAR